MSSQTDTHTARLIDETILLNQALESTDAHTHLAQRAFDQQHIPRAIHHMTMICQPLRSIAFSLDVYYQLWQSITEALISLEIHFDDIETQYLAHNMQYHISIEQLYELVQYTSDIVPRLYLTILVASVYIKTKRVPPQAILFDLLELCRGVQQPIHGLFLRSFFSTVMKDKLPDTEPSHSNDTGSIVASSASTSVMGTVDDSIELLLLNFAEMNKLWVRIQHQGSIKDRQIKETQRKGLKQLIGASLVRISDLQGLTYNRYRDIVLPRTLEHIVNSKDVLAQDFLMQCIVQVFPDEYQIGTLEQYLATITELQERVHVQDIIPSLLRRLATYAINLRDGTVILSDAMSDIAGLDKMQVLFTVLSTTLHNIPDAFPRLSVVDIISLYSSLILYISAVHPDRLDFIDESLGHIIQILRSHNDNNNTNDTNSGDDNDNNTTNSSMDDVNAIIVEALSAPIAQIKLQFLHLSKLPSLVALLNDKHKLLLATRVASALLMTSSTGNKQSPTAAAAATDTNKDTSKMVPQSPTLVISDVGTVDALFSLIKPLLTETNNLEQYQIESHYALAIRLFHCVSTPNMDIMLKILMTVRLYLGQGSLASLQYTIPPLIYRTLQLAENVFQSDLQGQTYDTMAKRPFRLIYETLGGEYSKLYPISALQLFLDATIIADKLYLEKIAYEFIVKSFLLYDDVAESKLRLSSLLLIIGTISKLKHMSKDNYDNIVGQTSRHASTFLVKADQARLIAQCAHLHWPVVSKAEADATQAAIAAATSVDGDNSTTTPSSTDDPENDTSSSSPTPLPTIVPTRENKISLVMHYRDDKKVLSCLRRALNVARDYIGNQIHLFVEILNKYIYFRLHQCPSTELDHVLGLATIITDAMEQSGLVAKIAKARSSGLDLIDDDVLAAQYFKNTVAFMITKGIISSSHPVALFVRGI